MPIHLLIVIPLLLTLCLGPFLKARLPLQRLAAMNAFLVGVILMSLFVASEWRPSYGAWKLGEGILAILFNSLLVAVFHWAVWSLGLRLWCRLRGVAPSGPSGSRQ